MQILIGCTLALGFSWGAWKAHALTKKGMWAAAAIGGIIYSFGRLPWSIPILGFFLSSSFLTLLQANQDGGSYPVQEKRQPRDWGQVLANGSAGAVLAAIALLRPGWEWPVIAYAGAMAAVNADTWATELGSLSPINPRLITSWKTVEAGISGGVTLMGSLSALTGSVFIALITTLVFPRIIWERGVFIITLAGLTGSLVDSLLGASVQAMYFCPKCGKETEQHPLHSCQTPTLYDRGWIWLNNDGVNLLSSVAGGWFSVFLWSLFPF
ncbi:MAG: DUF92 domain-containing protein [Anaerolineales bacterium]